MIEMKMSNKFLRLNPRKQKKKINLMLRTLIHNALMYAGVDSGPIIRDTKRSFVQFATADISGKRVTFTFFDEP
jgi:hypothetical protein